MSTTAKLVPARRALVLQAVRRFAPSSVNTSNAEKLDISVLNGGVTNELYRVKNTETKKSVVVRIYGQETDRIICREAELFFQSKFLKTFGQLTDEDIKKEEQEGGGGEKQNSKQQEQEQSSSSSEPRALVYEFLDDMRPIEPLECAAFAPVVARTLAKFHVKATQSSLLTLPYCTQENHCIHALKDWYTVAEQAVNTTSGKSFEPLRGEKLSALHKDCEWLRDLLVKAKPLLPSVICHNDLLGGNVMVDKAAADSKKDVSEEALKPRFIDFEYTRRDFALYDVANHWNEWAGLKVDFSLYPKSEQQRDFIKEYLKTMADLTDASKSEKAILISDASINKAVISANFLSLATNLAWSVWSLVQHAYSAIEFDYLTYYGQRYDRFKETKKEFAAPFIKEVLGEDPKKYLS